MSSSGSPRSSRRDRRSWLADQFSQSKVRLEAELAVSLEELRKERLGYRTPRPYSFSNRTGLSRRPSVHFEESEDRPVYVDRDPDDSAPSASRYPPINHHGHHNGHPPETPRTPRGTPSTRPSWQGFWIRDGRGTGVVLGSPRHIHPDLLRSPHSSRTTHHHYHDHHGHHGHHDHHGHHGHHAHRWQPPVYHMRPPRVSDSPTSLRHRDSTPHPRAPHRSHGYHDRHGHRERHCRSNNLDFSLTGLCGRSYDRSPKTQPAYHRRHRSLSYRMRTFEVSPTDSSDSDSDADSDDSRGARIVTKEPWNIKASRSRRSSKIWF